MGVNFDKDALVREVITVQAALTEGRLAECTPSQLEQYLAQHGKSDLHYGQVEQMLKEMNDSATNGLNGFVWSTDEGIVRKQ